MKTQQLTKLLNWFDGKNSVLVEETRAVITEEIRRNHFVKALTKK